MPCLRPALAATLSLAMLAATAALAQSDGPSVELNALRDVPDGCRATFVTAAPAGAELTELSAELALFDADGIVERLVVLDFGGLPAGGTRVLQFDLAGAGCDSLARLLVNRVTACTLGDGSDCAAALALGNRTEASFGR